MESSFLTALYCGVASSHSPVVMLSLSCEIYGSKHDSSSTSCTDIGAGVDVSGTNQINSSASSFVHTPFLFQDLKVGQQCFVYQVHTAF